MSQADADRNLLFGILALQMKFITEPQLVAAMQAWIKDKDQSLGMILIKQAAITNDTQDLLKALVDKNLAQHGNDPQKCLASMNSLGTVKEDLKRVFDPDLQTSLSLVPDLPTENYDPYVTRVTDPTPSASNTQNTDPFATVTHDTQSPTGGTTARASSSPNSPRFRILRPHARGGLGEVLVAHDQELGREVALKQIQDRHADNTDSRSRFMLEAEITGGLEHPGIVPVYGLGHYADGRPFYAMRFIRGDSLKDACERFHKADVAGRDPGERSLELRSLLGRFVDVCNAIAYAHSRGVLHRDLKPGNIMLGKYGETLVVDWGLAKTLDDPENVSTEPGEGTLHPSSGSMASNTVMGSAMGTPQFMSPEQAAGRLDQLGPPSDVYSLGATLYFLLTGQPPITDKDLGTTLTKVQRGEFPRPRQLKPDLSPALEAICLKAMALRTFDRYGSPRTLADDIEHWLADEPVSAWTEPWTVRARRWVSRHGMLVTGAVTGVVVATIVLTVATFLLSVAWKAESIAKDRAVEKEKEAKAQKVIAEKNYRLARQAVDRYHTEVSESVLLHEPGMQPLRRKLLIAAKEYYEKFLADRGQEPDVQGEMGQALFRLAQITGDIDEGIADAELKAIDLHVQAKKIFETLTLAHPESEEWRSSLASTWHHLGRLYRHTNQLQNGEVAYGQALYLWEPLVGAYPEEDRYRADQARSQLGLGNIYQFTGRLDKAETVEETALKTRADLVKKHPKVPEYQRDLAVSFSNLAVVYKLLGADEAESEKAYNDAMALQKQLALDYPHISQYQNDLARSYFNLGDLYYQSEQKIRAEAPYQEAASLWEKLVTRHPAMTDYRINLAEAYTALSRMYGLTKQAAKAEETSNKAIDINKKLVQDHGNVTNYHNDLARGYTDQGNMYRSVGQAPAAEKVYLEAERILEILVKTLPNVPQPRADLARVYFNLGHLYADQRQKDKAVAAYRESLNHWEKLDKDHPRTLEYCMGLNDTAYSLGNLERKNGNPRGGLDWYARAIKTIETLPEDKLKESSLKAALRDAHRQRAEALTQLGQFAEALPEWDFALNFAAGSKQRDYYQLYHAQGLARAGEHVKAVEEANQLLDKAVKAKAGEAIYQLACVYALSMDAVKADAKLTPDARQALSEQYARRSLETLETVRGLGFFQTLPNFEHLKKDVELAPLRVRDEFRKLIGEIEEKLKSAS